MKRSIDSHSFVDEVLKENMDSDVPPDVEHRLRKHLSAFRERLESLPAKRRRPWLTFSWPQLALAGGAAVTLLVVLTLILLSGASPGTELYAATMEALKSVRTIHVSGWVAVPSVAAPFATPSMVVAEVAYPE